MDGTDRLEEVCESPVAMSGRDDQKNDNSPSGASVHFPASVGLHSGVNHRLDGAFAPQRRTGTELSATSTGSAALEPPWTKQYALSFDGGGIRGYSSLLIIRELMNKIADEEEQWLSERTVEPASSSYDPVDPVRRYSQVEHTSAPPALDDAGPLKVLWKRLRNKDTDQDSLQTFRTNGTSSSDGQTTPAVTPAEKGAGISNDTARARRCRFLPCHYFDYMGGTSTGGLICILLSRLRLSVDDSLDEYRKLAGEIFGHPRIASIRPSWRGPFLWPRDKYDGQRVVNVVNNVVKRRNRVKVGALGQDLLASGPSIMCKTLVVSYQQEKVEDSGDLRDEPPYLFRSYDHHPSVPKVSWERNPGHAHRIPIWQVARATSAAPTYFDSITIENRKFADGGFGTNNPTNEIFNEVRLMNGNEPSHVALVLSIGTGKNPVRRFNDKFFSQIFQIPGALKGVATDCEKVHELMLQIDKPASMRYQRFNVEHEVLRRTRLDEWKAPNWRRKENFTIQNITQVTEEYLKSPQVQEDLKQIAHLLVANRRERCHSALWRLAATGKQYRCLYPGCPSLKYQKMRDSQKSLEKHLKKAHGLEGDAIAEFLHKGENIS